MRWDHVFTDTQRLNVLTSYQWGQEYRNSTGIPGPAASGNIWTRRQPIANTVKFEALLVLIVMIALEQVYGYRNPGSQRFVLARDVIATAALEKDLIHAYASTPDSRPSGARLALACRRLHNANPSAAVPVACRPDAAG